MDKLPSFELGYEGSNPSSPTNIEEYVKLPLSKRQAHLKLNEPCIERGGAPLSASTHARGMLAHIFNTTIPYGHVIFACHACNNNKCLNLHHLYWGTSSENSKDLVKFSGKTPWERIVESRKLSAPSS